MTDPTRRPPTPTPSGPGAILAAILGAFVLLGLAGPGCAAPTLPLPPPTALVSTPDAEGIVTVTGLARPVAIVMVLNEDRRAGVIGEAEPDGSYSLRIAASIGETLTVWQMVGTTSSQLVSRSVPSR
jgi:hypothetical protein